MVGTYAEGRLNPKSKPSLFIGFSDFGAAQMGVSENRGPYNIVPLL